MGGIAIMYYENLVNRKELKKLFILRKGFLNNPVKELQEKISDIKTLIKQETHQG